MKVGYKFKELIKKLILIILLATFSLAVRSQVPPLFDRATQRIFIKGPDSSCVALYYYVGDYKHSMIPIERVQPFSIRDNLSLTSSGKRHLIINIYRNKFDAALNPESRKMSIDIEFRNLPDTVDYYPNIPFVIPGKILKSIIYPVNHNAIAAENCCRSFIDECRPHLTKLIDITSVVFPKNSNE